MDKEEYKTELQNLRDEIKELKDSYQSKLDSHKDYFDKYNQLYEKETNDKEYYGRVAGNYYGRKNELNTVIEDLEELLK